MSSKKIKKKNTKENIRTIEPINFYQLEDVQAFSKQSHNPFYDLHNIKIPMRALIIGASGSQKTNTVLNILRTMNQTFSYVELYCKCADEPLYDYLKTKIDPTMLKVFEGLTHLNKQNLNEYYKDKGQTLVICDDLCLEKDQSKVEELAIRGRKLGDGVSLIYLTQKYFKVPTTIRGQLNYLILKKISGKGDIKRILADSSLSATPDELVNMYKYCTNGSNTNWLLIDLEASQDKTYRKNFTEYLNPVNFTPILNQKKQLE